MAVGGYDFVRIVVINLSSNCKIFLWCHSRVAMQQILHVNIFLCTKLSKSFSAHQLVSFFIL